MNKKETNYEGGANLLSDGTVKKLGKINMQEILLYEQSKWRLT